MTGDTLREGTARLFRSVRAGRSWLRETVLKPEALAPAGCVVLKSGDGGPPVFMIPGAPGSIFQLGPVAAELALPLPVYAVKPRGFDEGQTPFESLAEMAEYNIGVIAAAQAAGPYLLVGYSVGGLVALEMARRLAAAGRTVPLVVLLDTYPSRRVWPLRCHLDILVRRTAISLWGLPQRSPARAARYLLDRTRGLIWYLADCGVRWLRPPPLVPEGVSPASRRLHQASVNAGNHYRPLPYGGKVVFIQPQERYNLEPRFPGQVWGRFLSDLEVRQVPGSHLSIVEADAASTAAELSLCLERVVFPQLAAPLTGTRENRLP